MKTVSEILGVKGRAVWTIQQTASVFDALKLMAEKDVGALVVLDGKKPTGIISERDYARKIVLKGDTSKETPVWEIMSEPVIHATIDQTVEECMALMTEKHIRHIPILEDGRLAGLVSIGDLVSATISDQKHRIEQLERYIQS